MASVQEAVKRLTIDSRTQGVIESTQQVKQLTKAQNELVPVTQKVTTATGQMEQALQRNQQALQLTYQRSKELTAVNDNLAGGYKAANDNYQQFGKSLADHAGDFLNNVNHLKLMALAAYALSPVFRAVVATGVVATFTAIGVVAPTAATALASVVRFMTPMLAFFSTIAIPVAALVATWMALNYVWKTGADLLDRYSKAGPADFTAKIAALSKDSISAAQASTAADLAARLSAANAQISNFFTIQFDVTDSALKLQNVWVTIREKIADVATYLNSMTMPEWLSNFFAGLVLIAKFQAGASLPGGTSTLASPADPNAAMNAARALYSGAVWQNATDEQRANLEKKGYSATFATRFSGAPVPEAPDASTNAYDRRLQQVKDQIDLLALEAAGVGKTTQAYQEMKVAHELNIAAMKANVPVTDAMRAQWKALGDKIAEYTVKLNQAKVLQDETFKSQTMFMSPAEQAAANAAHQIDPTNWAAHLKDAGPQLAALNSEMGQLRDTSLNFMQSFNSDIVNGTVSMQTLANAVKGLATKLLDIAENQLINSLFKNLGTGSGGFSLLSLFGIGGSGTGGANVTGGNWATPMGSTTPFGGISVPTLLSGGMVDAVGGARAYVHPAYFDNAPHAASGLDLSGGAIPIIAHRGERVLNRQETAAYNSGGSHISVSLDLSGANGDRAVNDIAEAAAARGMQIALSKVPGLAVKSVVDANGRGLRFKN